MDQARVYHTKLVTLKKEMASCLDKSAKLKVNKKEGKR